MYYLPNLGLIFSVFLMFFGCIVAIAPKLLFDIPHIYDRNQNSMQQMEVLRHHYFGTEQHISSYLMGMIVGFLIKRYPNLYLGGRIGELFLWYASNNLRKLFN